MMWDDIRTVMWKESKLLFRVQGSRRRALLSQGVVVLMMAVILPLQMGEEWFSTAWSLVAAVIIPAITIGIAIPESFAGERERHTLEALLASRLPDRAILFGKVGLGVVFGWGMALAVLLVSLIPANLIHWSGRIAVYDLDVALAYIGVSLLVAGLMANLGVLISLRSATVQGAQQALMMVMIAPLLVLQVVPMLMLSVVPDGEEKLKQWLSVDFTTVILVVGAVLLVASLAVLWLAMVRFQRARLLLD
jgi:ABC-2 type transport system permease protein